MSVPSGAGYAYHSRRPVTQKRTFVALSNRFYIGSSCMQGWRQTMEDAHSISSSLPETPNTTYFGVFDGHGGSSASDFASKHLYRYIVTRPAFNNGDIKTAIEEGFLELDEKMESNPLVRHEDSGAVAVVVFIIENTIYCANVGDCRAVAFVGGQVESLTTDHLPQTYQERLRIHAAGGYIVQGRINGDLAVSRAFGDYIFKAMKDRARQEQLVISFPEVSIRSLDVTWQFLVLASDGIWEVMSNEQVCDFVSEKIEMNVRPHDICEELLNKCLSKEEFTGVGTGLDNMTVIIVVFTRATPMPYQGLTSLDPPASIIQYVCNQVNCQ